MTSSTASTLIFIDAAVDDYQSLMQGVSSGADSILLDPSQDGVEQIGQILATRRGFQSIQIVSHGNIGSLQLGTAHLNATTLDRYAGQLRQWATALAEGADILLYGCNVAAGAIGRAFVQRLSQLIGVDIAASETLTGSAAQGGDWELGFTTGAIATPLAFQPEVLAAYAGVLVGVNSYAALAAAITTANSNPAGNHTITINGNINLLGALPTITSNIEFVGNNFTVNGAKLYRAFSVSSGTVRFTNLTIANGLAQGAAGTDGGATNGGNGGVGQGGGLSISGGNVTLVNVAMNGNRAVGGTGGDSLGAIGGNGGNGYGGAIYVGDGASLRLSNTTFNSNTSDRGIGGIGANNQNGQAGLGKGGAIYVSTNGTVISEGEGSFVGNQASDDLNRAGDDNNIFGSLSIVTPPEVVASPVLNLKVQPMPSSATL